MSKEDLFLALKKNLLKANGKETLTSSDLPMLSLPFILEKARKTAFGCDAFDSS